MNVLTPTGETTAEIAREIAQFVSDKCGGREGGEVTIHVRIDPDPMAFPPIELDDERAEMDAGGDVRVVSSAAKMLAYMGEIYAVYHCRITEGREPEAATRRAYGRQYRKMFNL